MKKNISKFQPFILLVNNALNWAGLLVLLVTLLDPEALKRHSCPSPEENYAKDLGKIIFMVGFLSRFLAVPAFKRILTRFPKKYNPSDEYLSLVESEVIDSAETIIFILLLSLQTWKNAKWASFLLVGAFWPIFALMLHARDINFSRGTKSDYERHYEQHYQVFLLTVLEGCYNLLSLSSAISFLLPLIINVTYDSTHTKSLPDHKFILNFFMGMGALIGFLSVFHRGLLKAVRFSEGAINAFYYFFMFAISTLYCATPKTMNNEGFENTGWIPTLGLAMIGLVLAFFAGKNNKSFMYSLHKKALKQNELLFYGSIQDVELDDIFNDNKKWYEYFKCW